MGGRNTLTTIQRIIRKSAAWLPRDGAAVLPISVEVEGESARLVPDLCREIANRLPGYVFGESVIPQDAAPQGTVIASARVAAGLIVSLEPRARVLTDVKARRFAPPPLRGADGLDVG